MFETFSRRSVVVGNLGTTDVVVEEDVERCTKVEVVVTEEVNSM